MRLLPLLAAILLTTSCNKAPDDVVPSASTDAAPAAKPSAADANAAPPVDSILNITPVRTDNCKPSGYTAELTWSLPAERINTGIEVRVNKPDGGLLAYKQARRASATTGNWVTSGTKFFLVDRQTGEVITEVTAGEYDCR